MLLNPDTVVEDDTFTKTIEFMDSHPKMQLKMGVVEGEFYNESQIVEFANIPSREVLLAKLLGSLKAPMSNFAYLIDALIKKQEA